MGKEKSLEAFKENLRFISDSKLQPDCEDQNLAREDALPRSKYEIEEEGESFETENLLSQVLTAISQIYKEYQNDFLERKKKRLSSRDPVEQQNEYNLVIDKNYKKRMKDEIELLVQKGCFYELQTSFYKNAKNLIEELHKELLAVKDKRRILQVVFLVEVYHSVKNSSTQIGKIANTLFTSEDYSFGNLNLSLFYEKIYKHYYEIIKFTRENHPRHYSLDMLREIEKDLRSGRIIDPESVQLPQPILKKERPKTQFDYSTDDEESAESLHNMDLDELVNFINNAGTKRRKKKKKKNKQRSSTSPKLDREVDEFKKRLEISHTPKHRVKLNLSDDFIKRLRSQLGRLNPN